MRNNTLTYPSIVRRRLFHPLTSAILLALILADAWLISTPGLIRGYSTAGAFLQSHILRVHDYPAQPPAPHLTVLVLQPGGEFRIFHPDDESTWDQVTTEAVEHNGSVITFRYYRPISFSRGFWAPTSHIDRHHIDINGGADYTPAQRAAARRQFVEQSGAAAFLSRPDFQTLTTTDIDRTRPIALGYLHNTAAAAALILFLLSLRWLPQTPAWIRTRIGARRLSRGLCPRCRYNLQGLREPRCPECGLAIERTANSE
jgi:hypothetical protein